MATKIIIRPNIPKKRFRQPEKIWDYSKHWIRSWEDFYKEARVCGLSRDQGRAWWEHAWEHDPENTPGTMRWTSRGERPHILREELRAWFSGRLRVPTRPPLREIAVPTQEDEEDGPDDEFDGADDD